MNKELIVNSLKVTFHKIGFVIKKHSPEILLGAGIVGAVATTVVACKETEDFVIIKESHQTDLEDIKSNPIHTSKDIAKEYISYGKDFVKIYAGALTLGTASLASAVASYNIIKGRNLALAAAYNAVSSSFSNYRANVIERYGDKVDHDLKYGIKEKTITETVVDKDGKKTKVKKTVEEMDENSISGYARFFDESCDEWKKNPELNLFFLRQQQAWFNTKLKADGHVFLNDVYSALGIPKTKAGQVVGWSMKNPNGDHFIDFGIYNDKENPRVRDFVNGYERNILLDFNVDGPIWDYPLE